MQNAVALGTFDGLHKGHSSVLNIPDNYTKIALIFEIPPKCLKKGQIELLLTPEEKKIRLEKMGFRVVSLDFEAVKQLTSTQFLEYINTAFNPKLVSCGFNYRFGFGGEGDTLGLAKFCSENSIILKVASPVRYGDETISSSIIRNALKNGDIKKANRLLGYDFSFKAPVIKGDGRGKGLGFPTINQAYPKILTPLKFGVYKTEISVENKLYEGITNIGVRPTFPVDYIISETFIRGFSGDLYGSEPTVILKDFIRAEKKFSSSAELKQQILKDIGE